jgi:hypothetical protein
MILSDVNEYIMPGVGDIRILCFIHCELHLKVVHWQHPRFHAYFPAGNSYPSILADMLSDGIGLVGFSWVRLNKHQNE